MFDFEKIKKKIEEGLLVRSQIQGILDQASFLNLNSDQINYLQISLHKLEEKIYFVDDRGNVEIKKIVYHSEIKNEPPKITFGWLGHESESMRLAISQFLNKPKNELPELEWNFETFNSQRNYHSIANSYLKILKYLHNCNIKKPSKVIFHSFYRCSILYSNDEISHAEIFGNKILFVHKIQDKKHFFCHRCDTHFEVPFITHTVTKMCPCCGGKIKKSFETFEFDFEKDQVKEIGID
jgi:hypothetical protein